MGDNERAPQLGDRPTGITTQEYWSTVIAVFVIGNLTSWALFGRPNGIRSVFQWGSIAELIAAAGTWVIGYGAWKYARITYLHNAAQTNIRISNEKEIIRAKFATLSGSVISLANGKKTLSVFTSKSKEHQTQGSLDYGLKVSEILISRIIWTEADRSILSEKQIFALADLELSRLQYLEAVSNLRLILKIADVPQDPLTARQQTRFNALCTLADELNTDSTAFLDGLKKRKLERLAIFDRKH